jgi:hypothetical protein
MRKISHRVLALFLAIALFPAGGLDASFQRFSKSPTPAIEIFESEALSTLAVWVEHTAWFLWPRHAAAELALPPAGASVLPDSSPEHISFAQVATLPSAPLPPTGAIAAFNRSTTPPALQELFIGNDGVDFATTVTLLEDYGVLKYLERQTKPVSFRRLVWHMWWTQNRVVNSGYLRVALRLIAAQGWLIQSGRPASDSMTYVLTSKGRLAIHPDYVRAYLRATQFLQSKLATVDHIEKGFPFSYNSYKSKFPISWWLSLARQDFELPEPSVPTGEEAVLRSQVLQQLRGILLRPIVVMLVDRGVLKLFQNPNSKGRFDQSVSVGDVRALLQKFARINQVPFEQNEFTAVINALEWAGWILEDGGIITWTLEGQKQARLAWSSGVPVSYMPRITRVGDLLVGDPREVSRRRDPLIEADVARPPNVKGSDAAHESYFKEVCHLLREKFNRPIEQQDDCIMDTGAGKGGFLIMAYADILENTLRGRLIRAELDRDPTSKKYQLLMGASDLNREAQKLIEHNLSEARIEIDGKLYKIPHFVVQGDISDPHLMEKMFAEQAPSLDPKKVQHFSSMLIHNRQWRPIRKRFWWIIRPFRKPLSTGAYVVDSSDFKSKGYTLDNRDLEQNLLEWFEQMKAVASHIMFTELHTMPWWITAQTIGDTAQTSYDATHFYSGQFIIEWDVFVHYAQLAGWTVEAIKKMPALLEGYAPITVGYFRVIPDTDNEKRWIIRYGALLGRAA